MKARLEQGGGSVVDEISGRPLDLELLRALAANSLNNEATMRAMHSGFRGRRRRRFLAARDTHTLEERSDLMVHVLGTLKDRNVIRDMDPPARQSYLRHLAAATAAAEPVSSRRRPFARLHDRASGLRGRQPEPGRPDEIKEIAMTMMPDDDLAVVVSLDRAINGTSLMPKFEFGSAFLIPPGDAQWASGMLPRDDISRELTARTHLRQGRPPRQSQCDTGRIPGRRAANGHPDVNRRRLGAPSAGVAGDPTRNAARSTPQAGEARHPERPWRTRLAGTQVRPEIGINFSSPAEGGATWPNGHAAVRDGWSTPPPWAPACSRSPVATSFAPRSPPIPTHRWR
jgi:hypothetical protein